MNKSKQKGKQNFKKNDIRTNRKGDKTWYRNNVVHREGKPAIVYADGSKDWLIDGLYHNLAGPARTYPSGRCDYYINGEWLSEDEFNERVLEEHEYD